MEIDDKYIYKGEMWVGDKYFKEKKEGVMNESCVFDGWMGVRMWYFYLGWLGGKSFL